MGCGRVVHRPVPDLGCFTGREYGVYVLKWLPLRVLWWLRDTVTAAVRVWSLGPAPSARRSCGQQTNNQKSKTWLWLKARLAVCILPPGPQSPEVSPSPSQRAGCPPCRRLSTSSGAQHSALSRLPRRSPGVLCTWPLGAPLKPGWKGRRQGCREGTIGLSKPLITLVREQRRPLSAQLCRDEVLGHRGRCWQERGGIREEQGTAAPSGP